LANIYTTRRTAMEEYGCNCSFDSAGNPVDWCSFHEALRDSLAEKDKEIEQLEAENDNMRKIFDGLMDELQTWTTSRWSALQETKDERCGKCGRMFWHHIKAKMNLGA
jgi:hypothetical protein